MDHEDNQKVGFLQGPQGEFSSGRLMKLLSFTIAVLFAVAGFIELRLNPDPTLSNFMLVVVGLFLGVATGSELVSKITNH